MNVKIQYAVLSYTTDLTDPKAVSAPLAVIAVGDLTDTAGFVFFGASHGTVDPAQDPFGVVRELPRLLESKINEGLRDHRPNELLTWLQPKLRQSLSLRDAQSTSIEAEGPDQIVGELMALYHRVVPPKPDVDENTPPNFPTVHFQPTTLPA
jgi:hypothetical protein